MVRKKTKKRHLSRKRKHLSRKRNKNTRNKLVNKLGTRKKKQKNICCGNCFGPFIPE